MDLLTKLVLHVYFVHTGGASVRFQMLNKQSRSYFQRAYAISGSAVNSFAFTKVNHVQLIRDCSKNTEMDKLIEYLKTENTSTLFQCPHLESPNDIYEIWAPVIESNETNDAFLTKTPEEIYKYSTEELPIMDTMFSFTAQVLAV